jgi:hypothetical protein
MTANSTVVDTIVKKILILSAKLRPDSEVREIQKWLERALVRSHLEIIVRWKVRGHDLQRALLYHESQIVHFFGHGTDSDGLVLTKKGTRHTTGCRKREVLIKTSVGDRAAIEVDVGFYDAIGFGRSIGVGR